MAKPIKELVEQTAEAFRLNPENAMATFVSESTQVDAFHSQVQIRQHQLNVDEPEAIGGSDAGPNPVELLLASLGTCQEITYRAWASALDIPLRSVSVRVEGDIDLRRLFGVSDDVRPGFQNIRAIVEIDSDADPADIAQLKRAVDTHCPVLDMLQNPVPVSLTLASGADKQG